MAKDTLTRKEKIFCKLYAAGYNGTQAAIEAGYSRENAASIASHMLDKPKIIAYIAELDKEICRAAKITPELIGGRMERLYHQARQQRRGNQELKVLNSMKDVCKMQYQFGTADTSIEIEVAIDED